METGTIVTVVTSVLGFLGGIAGSYFMWRKSSTELKQKDSAEFRDDILAFVTTLTNEVNGLRERVHKLESEVIEKNKTVIKLELDIARIARALIADHGIHLEDLLKKTGTAG